MLPLALSTCGEKEYLPHFLEDCRAAGITALEISCTDEMAVSYDYAAFIRKAAENGISIWSFHLPFYPFETIDISAVEEEKRRGTVAHFAALIKKFSAFGIRIFVIHPSLEPIADDQRKAKTEAAKRSLAELAGIAASYGAVIAVEDLPRSCLGRSSSEILELLSADDRLMCCFDTNHLLGEDPVAFAEAVGSRIITLHVSDYDFADERHWMPGDGAIDWAALIAALRRISYHGPWLYEIPFRGYLNDLEIPLTPADIAENAKSFEGEFVCRTK